MSDTGMNDSEIVLREIAELFAQPPLVIHDGLDYTSKPLSDTDITLISLRHTIVELRTMLVELETAESPGSDDKEPGLSD